MNKILLGTIFALLAYINYRHLNLGFLSIYSIDEYAFHGSLVTMYEGLMTFDIKKLFSFGFYSYGFGFFVVNLLATIPFFLLNDIEMTIYAPRLVTSFFAVGTVYVVYKLIILNTDKVSALLLALLLVLMPAFWRNALWFHPDWMMTFFLLLSIYFYRLDNWNFKKYFWYANIFFGIALAVKIQTITFLPFIFLYIFYENIQQGQLSRVTENTKLFFKSIGLIFVTFIFINPYIVHPTGMRAFVSSFLENMKSNATNHGVDVKVTLTDKIYNAIDFYYLDIFIFCLVFVLAILISLQIFKKNREKSIVPIVSIIFIINISYLFLMVNKDWQHYYLSLFAISPLILIPLVQKYEKKKYYILGTLLFFQLFTHIQEFKVVLTQGYHPQKEIESNAMHKISNSLIEDIKPLVNKNTNILIEAYVPFDYQALNLKYQNIHIIYGPIAKNMFELEAFLEKSNSKDPSKFKQKDFIVIPKNSMYFDKDRLNKMVDKAGYANALEIIENLNSGTIGYEKFKENEYFYIWRKK